MNIEIRNIEIRNVDYRDPVQAGHLCELLNHYAKDPMGGGQAISESVLKKLPETLAGFPTAFSLIAYVDDQPAGLINCFYGFSTFMAAKLVNIHDVVVLPAHRGIGLSLKMLEMVEQVAQENGCCKLTLEVLDKNEVAMNAYRKFGFEGYALDPAAGQAVFWQKKI